MPQQHAAKELPCGCLLQAFEDSAEDRERSKDCSNLFVEYFEPDARAGRVWWLVRRCKEAERFELNCDAVEHVYAQDPPEPNIQEFTAKDRMALSRALMDANRLPAGHDSVSVEETVCEKCGKHPRVAWVQKWPMDVWKGDRGLRVIYLCRTLAKAMERAFNEASLDYGRADIDTGPLFFHSVPIEVTLCWKPTPPV